MSFRQDLGVWTFINHQRYRMPRKMSVTIVWSLIFKKIKVVKKIQRMISGLLARLIDSS